jgi:hypothetical protein
LFLISTMRVSLLFGNLLGPSKGFVEVCLPPDCPTDAQP